jgi:hypothetical protein
MAQVQSQKYPLLESGEVYFLYRPAVGVREVHGSSDVRRLYILLNPWSNQMFRLLVVYLAHARIRKSLGEMMRKLSVTLSQ